MRGLSWPCLRPPSGGLSCPCVRGRHKGHRLNMAQPAGPLSGIVVVDLTRILAGPWATHVLADLGATILKVEPPGPGDVTRVFQPLIDGASSRSTRSACKSQHRPARL